MRYATLFTIEGVLTKDDVGGPPMLPGKTVLNGLMQSTQPFFLTSNEDRQRVLEWLLQEVGVTQPKILGPDIEDPIRTVRYLGWDVSFFVSPSPAVCADALSQGVVALLFAAPTYQRPEFRPDHRGAVREWALVEAEVERQRNERVDDPRMREDFDDLRFGA